MGGELDATCSCSQWWALTQGRVGYVRRPNGAYSLRANPQEEWPRRALSPREVAVLRMCAQGHPNKVIAHALGTSSSSVSAALCRAARRAGAPSGRGLVQLVSSMFARDPGPGPWAGLTRAEQAVADLASQGLTNAEIARIRGCSVHTVANQMAAILRKTHLGSRRAVMVARPVDRRDGAPAHP